MSARLSAIPGVAVIGTASAFPEGAERWYSNEEAWRALVGPDYPATLAARGWDLEHPWSAWGVRRRHWSVVPGESFDGSDTATESLAIAASQAALQDAGLAARDLELVIAATSTPGRISSALAARICRELGTTAAGIDLRSGGTGGVKAWLTAAALVAAGAENALVVAAEAPSGFLDSAETGTALLYGDGAGALVLGRRPGVRSGLVGGVLGSLRVFGRPFTIPGPLPLRSDALERGEYRFQSPDADYGRGLLGAWRSAAEELRTIGSESRAGSFIASGATAAQIDAAETAFGCAAPASRAVLEARGCTGCAAALIGLDMRFRADRRAAGERLAVLAVGGGVACAGLVWEQGME